MSKPADAPTYDAAEIDRLFGRVGKRLELLSPDYWRRLVPELTISDEPFITTLPPYAVDANAMAEHVRTLRHEGYFQTDPVVDREDVAKLRDALERIVRAGHPPRYLLLYDEVYRVFARLGEVLRPALGDEYLLVPDEYEAYFVEATDDARGTVPHRDSLRTDTSVDHDGTPTLVNVWIPLADVEPPGSCIYVLPAHCDPAYPRNGVVPADNAATAISLGASELQGVRALPARAGAVLCWSTHLLHWGARSSSRAPGPRISIACYFQSRRMPAYHHVAMDIPSPVPFDYRVYLIEKHFSDPDGRDTRFRHLQPYARSGPK